MKDLREADKRGTQSWYLEIHIVSVDNECKELLVLVKNTQEGRTEKTDASLRLVCVNLLTKGGEERFEIEDGETECLEYAKVSDGSGFSFLFEPNASIMKAGCFDELAKRFRVRPLAQNSHLFVSHEPCRDFPGRQFEIVRFSSMNKKELRKTLAGVERANITVRNFPMTVAELRKRLKLKDGGDVFLFATTLAQGEHVLIIAKK